MKGSKERLTTVVFFSEDTSNGQALSEWLGTQSLQAEAALAEESMNSATSSSESTVSLERRGRFPYVRERQNKRMRGERHSLTEAAVLALLFFSGRRLAALMPADNEDYE